MLLPSDAIREVMGILEGLGVGWSPPSDNPLTPTHKGFFRGHLIAVYLGDDPLSEIKCLDPAYAQDFEELLKSFFQLPDENPES